MKIGFVSLEDAASLTPASVHSYYEARALAAAGLELHFLGPLRVRQTLGLFVRRAFSRLLRGWRLLPDREPGVVADLARQVAQKLERTPVDVVFSHGTIPLGRLECRQPVVFWSDATFAGMLGFYPTFGHLDPASLRDGNRFEQAALERSALAIYSSEWAARTCRENYRVDPARLMVVPFGANLEHEPPQAEVEELIRARPGRPCRLVFVGTEWRRKGGDLALGLAARLREAGLAVELTVIGCRPPGQAGPPGELRVAGYMDNSTSAGQAAYRAQLARAHFLVLPSRADCSPRVLYEAGAMGLPSLTTDVGGIGSIVRTGVNGGLFPPGEGFVEAAARFVLETLADPSSYRELARRTIADHAENHCWERSAGQILARLKDLGSQP